MKAKKSELTRERILGAALTAFRRKGFDATTMRDIAGAAGTSLGSTYYYFPSKESLVLAHWERQMEEHERRARVVFAETSDPAERLAGVIRARVDLIGKDRKLLTGLFRTLGDPKSPASVFAPETRGLRARGLDLFREALAVPSVPEDAREEAATFFWILLLAVVLYFIHDDSRGQARTKKLVEDSVATLAPLLPFLGLDAIRPLRARVVEVLGEAGLYPVGGPP